MVDLADPTRVDLEFVAEKLQDPELVAFFTRSPQIFLHLQLRRDPEWILMRTQWAALIARRPFPRSQKPQSPADRSPWLGLSWPRRLLPRAGSVTGLLGALGQGVAARLGSDKIAQVLRGSLRSSVLDQRCARKHAVLHQSSHRGRRAR